MKYIKITLLLILASSFLLAGCSGSLLQVRSWPGMAVDGELLYAASGTGVFAVRLNDGGLDWRYPVEADNKKTFFADPLLVDGMLAIGDYKNTFYGLDAATGVEQWQHEGTRGQYVAGAAALDDMIFVPSGDHLLYAFNMDGVEQWTFETDEPLWGGVAVNGSKVYLPVMDWAVYALDAKSGKEVWKVDLAGAVVSAPALGEDGTLYVSSLGKSVYAIDAERGSILWRYDTSDGVWASPTLHEGVIYVGDASGNFYAIDAARGQGLWQLDLGGTVVGSAAIYPEGLFVGTETGDLLAISLDGKKQWTRSVEGKLYATPIVTEDRIVAAVTDGERLLIAWDLQGNEIWTFEQPK
jgi:outer membrane protein assembly factor BamB